MADILPAHRHYVIFFTPRSGSSWLTSVLSATTALGYPEEYLNPKFLPEIARATNSTDPEAMLAMLRRIARTDNGVFGMEVNASDVDLAGEEMFFSALDSPHFFLLWRDNIVAQAISLYRAVTTGRFHATDPLPTTLPVYDENSIIDWIFHILQIEKDNVQILRRHGCVPIALQYEHIVMDRGRTVSLFADVMGVTLSATMLDNPGPTPHVKIADDWNLDVENRFRREQANLIGRVEAQRLIRQFRF